MFYYGFSILQFQILPYSRHKAPVASEPHSQAYSINRPTSGTSLSLSFFPCHCTQYSYRSHSRRKNCISPSRPSSQRNRSLKYRVMFSTIRKREQYICKSYYLVGSLPCYKPGFLAKESSSLQLRKPFLFQSMKSGIPHRRAGRPTSWVILDYVR